MSGRSRGVLRRSWRVAAPVGLAAWLAATGLAQHPLRSFDRIRYIEGPRPPLPDWRFFAPEPGRFDDHLMFRVQHRDGTVTPWSEVRRFQPRHWSHAFYFPTHREEKALIDATVQLMRRLTGPPVEIGETAEYRLLRGYVDGVVRREHAGALPVGFQFLLVRDTGHQEDGETALRLLSRFEALEPADPSPAATARRAGAGRPLTGIPGRGGRARR